MSDLFLRSVRFTDFRTFGKFEAELAPAPGLTLLVGTNGLGKSSFFDALEWGLTGEVRRFKSYMGAANQGKYLTRRGAATGTHEVHLGFSDDTAISRAPGVDLTSAAVIELLKREVWTAQIQDIGTYLAFTHFLGQAAQQRFTSRDSAEQWESLKGPSGIDRLDEVRRGLRGRATEMAFNRRVKRENEAIEEINRQLTEWRGWRVRLNRLRESADASGALPAPEFDKRLDELTAAVAKLDPTLAVRPDVTQSDRLASLKAALDALRQDTVPRRAVMDALADVPERYSAHAEAANPEAEPLVSAGKAKAQAEDALTEAEAAASEARELGSTAAATVADRDADLRALETARADIELAARAEADAVRLEDERQSLDTELTRLQAELQALDVELTAIRQRAAALAGLEAAAKAAAAIATLARQLPSLRDQAAASADARAEADRNAEGARANLTTLTVDRDRLAPELESARSALTSARERASVVAAAVAQIASHLHDDDVECPVCRSAFEPGGLRLVAQEASRAQDALLAAAEARHAGLAQQLEDANQGIVSAEAVLRVAEEARTRAEADSLAVAALEARIRAALPDSGDLIAGAAHAEQRTTASLAGGRAVAADDAARQATAVARRDDLRRDIPLLSQRVAAHRDQIAARRAAARSAGERLSAAGYSGVGFEEIDRRLVAARVAQATAETAHLQAETKAREAAEAEALTRTRRDAAQDALRRLVAAREAAAQTLNALAIRWQRAGLPDAPNATALESALSALAETMRDIDRLEGERALLVAAYEVTVRDQEIETLVADMEKLGGPGTADAPGGHETSLGSQLKAAQDALTLTQSTHTAVTAFADKLRDEATSFSTKFLTPLNGLIDDFNEALLSTPGESVRLNAAYHKDRTQFDMGLHYRDPLDDAIYDTGLPPQVVLSEGQLAANGFSILCAASTAYPWSRWRALLLDDPLQHNDIIHAAAFVDLMRNLVELQNYQLIMSSHDRGEAEFIRRKFDAAGLPCSVIALTAPSKSGVRYLPPHHNSAARDVLADSLARSA
ncbi:AAA family ATPase [Xanthobacter dioxanivorans]|uniref:AAA family ATPase n=1 Tax=Xanthobacter dioxanivorans TaxID=2528964 RepID=A0A974PRY9_9HYPH|nr:AAA family ATPase [Xanthobacter dioxanivorans]QRG08697.1 AAA family ATPase [Xanthobacter dioxanivorans]